MVLYDVIRLKEIPRSIRISNNALYIYAFRAAASSTKRYKEELKLLQSDIRYMKTKLKILRHYTKIWNIGLKGVGIIMIIRKKKRLKMIIQQQEAKIEKMRSAINACRFEQQMVEFIMQRCNAFEQIDSVLDCGNGVFLLLRFQFFITAMV